MNRKITIALAAGIAVAGMVAGCGSSPPTAQSLAQRIPGCHPRFFSAGVSPYAEQEVTCDPAAGTVWLATFTSNASELSFLNSESLGTDCVQGTGWAVTVNENGNYGSAEAQAVIRAIGGRGVSTAACD